MGDYTGSIKVEQSGDELFRYLSDVGNLPQYFSRMTSAEPGTGAEVKTTAELPDGRTVRSVQLRFYARVGRRLRDGVQAILHGAPAPVPSHTREGLVVAPSGIGTQPLETLSLNAPHPGA